MKKRLLAGVLTLVMLVTLLPGWAVAEDAPAAGEKASYTYTVRKNGVGADLRLRDPAEVYFDHPVTWGEATDEVISLEVTNTGNRALDLFVYGKMLTCFDVRWDSSEDVQVAIDMGGSAVLTIAPKVDIPVDYYDTLFFMETNSRRGWSLRVDLSVTPKDVTVTAADITKAYGQTLTADDIEIAVTDDISLFDLGVTFVSEGFAPDAAVQTEPYPIALDTSNASGKYRVSLVGAPGVRVVRATPEPVTVNATGIITGSALSQSELTGQYRNPYTGAIVEGELAWDNADAGMTQTGVAEMAYTFTPNDTDNYEVVHDSVEVIVSPKTPTEIVAVESSLDVIYNGQPQAAQFAVTPAQRAGELTVEYKLRGSEDWTDTVSSGVGVYDVRAFIPENDRYAAGSAVAVLTIAEKPVKFYLPTSGVEQALVKNKSYDGTTAGAVDMAYFTANNDLGQIFVDGDDVAFNETAITAEFASSDRGMHQVTVIIDGTIALTGADAGNYRVADTVVTSRSQIFELPIGITVKDLSKEYGRTITIENTDLTVEGLIDGDDLEDVHVTLESAGTAADADVGVYAITAVNSWGNYTVDEVKGELTVTQSTPEIVSVSAGSGRTGSALSGVSLTGSFQNPYTGRSVPGELTWLEGETTLGSAAGSETHAWVFHPQDRVNYRPATGTVSVTVTAASSGGGSRGGSSSSSAPAASTAPSLTPAVTADSNGAAKAAVSSQVMSDAVSQAKAGKTETIVIEPQVSGEAEKVAVELPKSSISDVASQTDVGVTVKTELGSVTIPNEGLGELAGKSGDAVTVSVEKVADNQAVDITVQVGKTVVDRLDSGLLVALPNLGQGNVLVAVQSDGTEAVIKKSLVNDGLATALLEGSATVAVRDNSKEFSDVADGMWYVDTVKFASSHELFNGTAEGQFSPDIPMTRAMLSTVLWSLEDAQSVETGAVFADVADGDWYAQGVAWASAVGIVNGYTDDSFRPDGSVTREEMAVMLYRYAGKLGLDTSSRGSLSTFADSEQISGWAAEAVAWAVGSGLMEGRGDGVLAPAGNATRAEVAAVTQRLIGQIVK